MKKKWLTAKKFTGLKLKEKMLKVSTYGSRQLVSFSFVFECLERQAGNEHVFNERRSRNQVFKLQVEDPLKTLNAERSQLGQFAEQTTKVMRLALCFGVVCDMIAQAINYFELKLFHFFRLFQPMTLC